MTTPETHATTVLDHDEHEVPGYFSGGYAPVLGDDDGTELPQTGASTSEVPGAKSTFPKGEAKTPGATTTTIDGVFGNLGVVDVGAASQGEAAALPQYRDVFDDHVAIAESNDRGALPLYSSPVTVGNVQTEDGEILVDGLPVGDFFTFIANLFVSITFDFLGYMMTTMLATSHAARCGSRSGLGMTLIRYGMLVLEKDQEVEEATYLYDPENYDKVMEVGNHNDFIAYIMIFAGFFVMLKANSEFVRAKRIEAVMLTNVADNTNNA
ncbi:hypothetical protein HDU98_008283 [Podochytrium sp. JEL0797]|nr:hypothetical protein HDU98_008283 [Podochytrium sp. JEL0797]